MISLNEFLHKLAATMRGTKPPKITVYIMHHEADSEDKFPIRVHRRPSRECASRESVDGIRCSLNDCYPELSSECEDDARIVIQIPRSNTLLFVDDSVIQSFYYTDNSYYSQAFLDETDNTIAGVHIGTLSSEPDAIYRIDALGTQDHFCQMSKIGFSDSYYKSVTFNFTEPRDFRKFLITNHNHINASGIAQAVDWNSTLISLKSCDVLFTDYITSSQSNKLLKI